MFQKESLTTATGLAEKKKAVVVLARVSPWGIIALIIVSVAPRLVIPVVPIPVSRPMSLLPTWLAASIVAI
jgi:hypothetical protein